MNMTRWMALTAMLVLAVLTATAQQTTYQINYSYEYDMQKYDYIKKLDYDDGTIVKEGERQITVKGITYQILSKDRDTTDDKRHSLQYTVADRSGAEYVICFNQEFLYTEELKYQVVFFNATNPYDWTYYITDSGTVK